MSIEMNFMDINGLMKEKIGREAAPEISRIQDQIAKLFGPLHEVLPREASRQMKVRLVEMQDYVVSMIVKDLIDQRLHVAAVQAVDQYELRNVYDDE